MNRHEFLSVVHRRYRPRSYLEIGVNRGRSLALSRTRTIGVDPEFQISVELRCDLKLVKATSDEFFSRPDAISWFAEGVVDFTFIDGMHLFEFALRDFMNTERLSASTSVVVLDDALPRSTLEAAREQQTRLWAGDAFKVAPILERYRPDLTIIPIDAEPTGLLLVLGLDPNNSVLASHYEEIVAEYSAGDAQSVPEDILHRRTAADPQQIVNSPVWEQLAAARESGASMPSIGTLRSLRGTAEFELVPPPDEPWTPEDRGPVPVPRLARVVGTCVALNRAVRRGWRR